MRIIYSTLIFFYGFSLKIASIFNRKARLWVRGRIKLIEKIKNEISTEDKIVWIHSASLGEFEQGRPLIESLKQNYPGYKILLTFFSPSGYEIRKNYELADYIYYLPLDTRLNAKNFIQTVKPVLAVFIKYDFWFNFLNELQKNNIPHIFISAMFRPGQYIFKWYSVWVKKHLRGVNYFFVQNSESKKLLEKIGQNNSSIVGDTRFDRVFELAKNCQSFPLIEQFKAKGKLIITGSTWPPDEKIIYPFIEKNPEVKFIIAPHDTQIDRINSIIKILNGRAIRYSEANEENIFKTQVIVIDSVGILAHLYQYALLVYIGGGFGTSIHNIQEPVTFGKPVIFGPKHKKFNEAVNLVNSGGAFTVNNNSDFESITSKLLCNEEMYQNASKICKDYIANNIGATKLIMAQLKNIL